MSEQIPQLSTLQEAIDFIALRFVFNKENYPVLSKLSPEEQLQFSINHNLLHMAKQLGRISTHLEDKDHGGIGNTELLHDALVKELINILRLAELLGFNEEKLLDAIPKAIK